MPETLAGRGPPGARGRLAWLLLALGIQAFSCYTPPNGIGGLRVTVLADLTSSTPVSAAMVSLVGAPISGVTNGLGVVLFPALTPGTYTVRAGVVGGCTGTVNAAVLGGTTVDVTVALCGTPAPSPPSPPPGPPAPPSPTPPPPGVTDQFTIGNPGLIPGVLLYDAALSTDVCAKDALVPGMSLYDLGVNALPPGTTVSGGETCHASATFFDPGHGLLFTNSAASLPWTAGADDLPRTLPPRLNVPVTIWIAPGETTPELELQIKAGHLAEAGRIFDAAGAGIALVENEVTGGDPDIVAIPASATGAALFPQGRAGCDDAVKIMAEPSVYRAGQLNVYYVKEITGAGSASIGYYCYIEGARSVLFIRTDAGVPHILAHELGHAFGLLEPNWGHTHEFLAGFLRLATDEPRNFMAYAAAGDVGKPVYASLGQAFRMNLSNWSWLNLPGSGGTTLRERAVASGTPPVLTCPCGAAEPADDCPVLALTDLPPENLSSTQGKVLACQVDPASNSVTVCAGQVVSQKAYFRAIAGGADKPASADKPVWLTSAPQVAALDPSGGTTGWDPTLGGWAAQKITGGQLGTATILLYAGGPSAVGRYDVTVKTCP